MSRNPTASLDFLSSFSAVALANYLDHLKSLEEETCWVHRHETPGIMVAEAPD